MCALGRPWGGQCRETEKQRRKMTGANVGAATRTAQVRAIKTATSKDQGCMDCSPPQFHPQLYLSDALRASGSRADGRFLPPSSQSQKAPSWGARQALTCRPTFAQSTPMVCPPVAPEQPPEKHEMRSAVVRAGRPAVIKMNSMGGNIDSMGEDLERARGRGEGAGNNGAMAGQIGQSGGAEKRQCSGVGPVRKRGGGIEMGGGVTAGPDGLSARPRAVARGAARGDQHVVDHLCQGHREAEHADRDPRPGEVGVQGRGRGGGRPLGRSCTCCKRPSAMSGQRRLSPAHRSQAWSGWSGRSSLMLYSRARGAWALTMAAWGRPG